MLTIKNLIKTYPKSDRIAVNDISFELRSGEIFGFLGQNGAGKSTTIKCLTGILPFDSGSIEICGYDIVKDPIKAKMNMGYVPDNHSVYEKLTGREYVNYVADLYKVPSDLRKARMDRFAKLFRLEYAMDRQIKSYSHGMKQKICIIAALIHEPKLWVLDEPMMGLDPQSTAEIIAHMREHCAKGNTVFFSSHNLDLVKKLCHRVAIVNEGRLIDLIDLEGNEENKANLEERFFRITGTYDQRLFEDYISQESEDMRPELPVKEAEQEESAPNTKKKSIIGELSALFKGAKGKKKAKDDAELQAQSVDASEDNGLSDEDIKTAEADKTAIDEAGAVARTVGGAEDSKESADFGEAPEENAAVETAESKEDEQ